MQHNPLVCRDNGELAKPEEIALLEKRYTNKEDSDSYINAGSIKLPKEHAINILREIEGEAIIHKTRKNASERGRYGEQRGILGIFFLKYDDSDFKEVQNKCLTIKPRNFP